MEEIKGNEIDLKMCSIAVPIFHKYPKTSLIS